MIINFDNFSVKTEVVVSYSLEAPGKAFQIWIHNFGFYEENSIFYIIDISNWYL